MLDNIPDFRDGEKPSAGKMNALRDAIAALLSGGITGSMLAWPLRAEGPLDMNGNEIINAASIDGAIHVNAAKSFASAVADVNAAGGGVIVIDSGYTAAAPSTGSVITAHNVRIMGHGPSSGLRLGSDSQFGLVVDGDTFLMDNLTITTSADTTTFEAAICLRGYFQRLERVDFSGNSAISVQLGDASNVSDFASIRGCRFSQGAWSCVSVRAARRFSIQESFDEDCEFFVEIQPGTTIATLGVISCNIIDASGFNGIVSGTVAAPNLRGLVIQGNTFECTGGVAIALWGFSDCLVDLGYVNGGVALTGDGCVYRNMRGIPDVSAHNCVDGTIFALVVPGNFSMSGTSTNNRIIACDFGGNVTFAPGQGGMFALNTVAGNTSGLNENPVFGFNDVTGSEL